jgi:hypothetical protein
MPVKRGARWALTGPAKFRDWTLAGPLSLLTDGPVPSTIQPVRGLLRVLVVGFTVVSLLIVAAVGVSASSGKNGTSDSVKHSVVALFSGHSEQSATHGDSSGKGEGNGDKHGDNCKPHKKNSHATGDHENDQCGGGHGDDSGSSG